MSLATAEADELRRRDIGEFLRARRDALQPEDVDLPRRGRRRVKGLRRYEVSDLAAVSVTWYTWLEQGRDIRTTPQVLDSVARALQLDEASHRYLRRLAGAPITETKLESAAPNDHLLTLLDELLPSPAALLDPTNALLAWNDAYAKLFVDPSTLMPSRRNGLVILLTVHEVREGIRDWEREARNAIGAFRAENGKHTGDERFAEVIELLNEESELFRATWDEHRVQRFVEHEVVLDHQQAGIVRARQLLLRPLGTPSVMLLMHHLADSDSRARVEALLASG